VRFLVAECTAYDDTRIVSRCDMEKKSPGYWLPKPRDAASASVTAEQFREMEGDEEIPPTASIEPKLKE